MEERGVHRKVDPFSINIAMREQAVVEARSNPDKNTKVSPLDQLRSIRDEHGSDLFVSFTMSLKRKDQRSPSGEKLGINPRTTFGTPLGIYCYPIDYVIEYSEIESEDGDFYNGGLNAPFTGYNAWQNAFVFYINDVNPLQSEMSEGEYERGMRKLKEILKLSDYKFDEFKYFSQERAEVKTPAGFLWNATRNAAVNIYEEKPKKLVTDSEHIAVWNALLRKLGYKAAVDNGTGYIHENEPTQAVILDPSIIKVVSVIPRSDGQERLFYSVKDRLLKDPRLLEKIPVETFSRIPLSVASLALEDYIDTFGSFDIALQRVLAHEKMSTLIYTLATRPKPVRDLAFAAYDQTRLPLTARQMSYSSIMQFVLETDYRIDKTMGVIIAERLRKAMLTEHELYETYRQIVDSLLQRPYRVEDWSSMALIITGERGGPEDIRTELEKRDA